MSLDESTSAIGSSSTASADRSEPWIDLLDGAFWSGDIHAAFDWMRANDPVHWDGRVFGVSRYQDIKDISRQPEIFSNADGCRPDADPLPQMIDFDDPEHFRRRKLVNRGFTPRRVRDSEAAVREACDEIIDAVAEKGECDFVNEVAALLPMIMIGDALGVAPADRARLLEWSDIMVKGLIGGGADSLVAATEAYLEFRDYITGAMLVRRAAPTDDLLSVLVHAEIDGDRLDDESVIHESLLILIGGDETTRHVISGGMYQLLRHPDQYRALADDRSLLPSAVEEMLRWVSPLRNMNRHVTQPTVVAGTEIPAGSSLLLLYPSANRDETVFENPHSFDIRRAPNEHVAFGFGSHFCLGNSLARLELTCMFDRLLDRLVDIELVDPTEPVNRPANFVSGYETMPVRFTPATPNP